uniref:Uncharacterized protein n=1 Tax=Cajanus cajan TaxID=3821 RepID=A0A151QZA6_CAJCA|nr:hypothetical protein KK1_043337 [Cajanus cajan]
MGNWTEGNTEKWIVKYKPDQENRGDCGYHLLAIRDNKGVEDISFGFGDDHETSFSIEIKRVGRDSLHGGITGIVSSRPQMFFSRAKLCYTIETTIVPCSYSYSDDGLFVLEIWKKDNYLNAFKVTMAHYYVTKDVGLSAVAKISHKKGNGFIVEVEGPFCHPSADLRHVLIQTRRSGMWSPDACPHCNGANRQGEQMFRDLFSTNIRGLINSSTGSTNSSLNPLIRVNNNVNFHGNGNGGFIEGGRVDFDSSIRNYYPGRYY